MQRYRGPKVSYASTCKHENTVELFLYDGPAIMPKKGLTATERHSKKSEPDCLTKTEMW